MGNFSSQCPPIDELQDYSYWVSERPSDVLQSVISHGGWARVFPTKVPDWANSIRNYFNLTPQKLKFLGGALISRIQGAPDIQKVGYWKGGIATGMALSGDVYIDGNGRYWHEMDTGGTGYHYKGGRTSKPGAVLSHFTPQAFIPIFKLVSPDGTGGSCEVCIHNWQRGIIPSGKSTIGELNKWEKVRTDIVINNHYQGSYNYSETVAMGFDAHDLRDIKPHKVMQLRYRNPHRWSGLGQRFFPDPM